MGSAESVFKSLSSVPNPLKGVSLPSIPNPFKGVSLSSIPNPLKGVSSPSIPKSVGNFGKGFISEIVGPTTRRKTVTTQDGLFGTTTTTRVTRSSSSTPTSVSGFLGHAVGSEFFRSSRSSSKPSYSSSSSTQSYSSSS